MDHKDLENLHRWYRTVESPKNLTSKYLEEQSNDVMVRDSKVDYEVLVNEASKMDAEQYAVMSLARKLRAVWCEWLLLNALYVGLQQFLRNKVITHSYSGCPYIDQIATNYLKDNSEKFPQNCNVDHVVGQATKDLFPLVNCSCGTCYPTWLPGEFFVVNGTYVVRAGCDVSVDNMNVIAGFMRQQPLLARLQYLQKSRLIQQFFEFQVKKAGIVYTCYCYIQPEIIALARNWYLQRNLLVGCTGGQQAKLFHNAKILTATNEVGFSHRVDIFNKYFTNSETLSKYEDVLALFYCVSDGKIRVARRMAKLIAEVLYHNCFNDKGKSIKVVVTNKPESIKHFLSEVFKFGLNQNGVGIQSSRLVIPSTLDSIVLDTCRRPNGDFYHMTSYSVYQLQNPNDIVHFHQDALYGHVLNITDLGSCNCTKGSFLDKVASGTSVTYKHPNFGESNFLPTGSYVFVTDKVRNKYFGEGIQCNQYEVYEFGGVRLNKQFALDSQQAGIILTYIAEWGNHMPDAELKKQPGINVTRYFFERCLERKDYGYRLNQKGQKKPVVDELTATSLRTVQAAYSRFSQYFLGGSDVVATIDKSVLEAYGYQTCDAKNDHIRARDLERGFSEQEVLKSESHTSFVVGCVVKSPKEIEIIAQQILAEEHDEETRLQLEDFIKIMKQQLSGNEKK